MMAAGRLVPKQLWSCTFIFLAYSTVLISTVGGQDNFEDNNENFEDNSDTKFPSPPSAEGQTDPRVKDLLTPNNLDPGVSFRCGMFYSGLEYDKKPKAKIFILPKRFPTTCPRQPEELGPVEAKCVELFKVFLERNTLVTPSKVRDPKIDSLGDDLCTLLATKKLRKLPPNKFFPDGIAIGFYFNACKSKKWWDTRLRMEANLCCYKDESAPEKHQYKYCPCKECPAK